MNAPQATLVVQFGDQGTSDAFVAAEFDDKLNVDSSAQVKTIWNPGDEIWFWVQHDDSVRIAAVKPTGSAGDIVDCGIAERNVEQQLAWPDTETTVELSHIPLSTPSFTWYGAPGVGLSFSGRTISINSGAPCTCDAAIPISVHLFRFIPPALTLADESEIYRVIIYIYMEAA
jgi:hypothetical protein